MKNKKELFELAKKYFKNFSNKDLHGLREMFSDDVELLAFDNEAFGVENVLNVNRQIFDSVNSIDALPLNVFVDDSLNTAVGDLIINVDGQFALKVVDIIKFTNEGKIKQIKAYKG
jgi:ketosteroid isomerase-like protein